eukprot:2005255-Rhodomonas_salina.1
MVTVPLFMEQFSIYGAISSFCAADAFIYGGYASIYAGNASICAGDAAISGSNADVSGGVSGDWDWAADVAVLAMTTSTRWPVGPHTADTHSTVLTNPHGAVPGAEVCTGALAGTAYGPTRVLRKCSGTDGVGCTAADQPRAYDASHLADGPRGRSA